MPPEPHGLVADLDAALVPQVLHVAERKGKSDVQHHRQTDDFRAAVEVLEGAGFGHLRTLLGPLPRSKQSSPDKTHSPAFSGRWMYLEAETPIDAFCFICEGW